MRQRLLRSILTEQTRARRATLALMRAFSIATFGLTTVLACNPSAAPQQRSATPAPPSTLVLAPVPSASPSPPAPALGGPGSCKRDADCTQEPDLHPCCGPDGAPIPKQMNCANKDVACAGYRSCNHGTCVGSRTCSKDADCPVAGDVHPCCSGTAPKEMNCAVKKVDCSNVRHCNAGQCSPPTSP